MRVDLPGLRVGMRCIAQRRAGIVRMCTNGNRRRAEPVPELPVVAVPGRIRAGLEDWLEEYPELPGALVESARALAGVVELDTDNSPLWGRYQRALDQLLEAVMVRREVPEEFTRFVG